MSRTGYYHFSEVYQTSDFCSYCGVELKEWEKVIDHFYPVSGGGGNIKSNLYISCRECNAIKSDKIFDTLSDARHYILPRKKNKISIGDYNTYNTVPEIDIQDISPYPELQKLLPYHHCSYVIGIGNIYLKRRNIIKKYLLYKFLPFIHDPVLSGILEDRKIQDLIVYRNSI